MSVSAAQLIEQAEHALSGPTALPVLQIVGEAVDYVASMHAWNFLKRPSIALASVAGQSYLALPSDFGEVLGVQVSGSTYANMVMTDPATFLGLESGALNETGWAYWTVIESAAGSSGGAPTLRLAIWPAPSATNASFALLRYRATIPRPTSDNDLIAVPSYVESLLFQVVRCFALGYEESDAGSADARLAEVMLGSIYMNAKRRDGRSQWRYGRFQNGAASSVTYGQFWEGTGLPA